MKSLIVVIVFLLVANFAQASVTYLCDNTLPQGKSLLTVKSGQNGPSLIVLKFHNNLLNEDFVGSLQVTAFHPNDGGILASGILRGSNANIKVNIQGSLRPDDRQVVSLVLFAGRDHRIDYGYGNPLGCKQTQ